MCLEIETQHLNTREQKMHTRKAVNEVAMQSPYSQAVREKEGRQKIEPEEMSKGKRKETREGVQKAPGASKTVVCT